jgi:hypothetical protein
LKTKLLEDKDKDKDTFKEQDKALKTKTKLLKTVIKDSHVINKALKTAISYQPQ